MEGHSQALTAALSHTQIQVTQHYLSLSNGQTEVDLTWSSGSTNFRITVKLSVDESLLEVMGTSNHMLLPEPDTKLMEFMGLIQEVLPFGSVQYNFGSNQAYFRTSQLLKGISNSEDLQTFHLNVSFSLLPIVSKSFEEVRSDANDLVLGKLKKLVAGVHLEL